LHEKHKDYKPLDEVINDLNFLQKDVISIDTPDISAGGARPPTFDTAFAEDKQYLITTFSPDILELNMKIYDMCNSNKVIKDVVLTKRAGANFARTQMWY